MTRQSGDGGREREAPNSAALVSRRYAHATSLWGPSLGVDLAPGGVHRRARESKRIWHRTLGTPNCSAPFALRKAIIDFPAGPKVTEWARFERLPHTLFVGLHSKGV